MTHLRNLMLEESSKLFPEYRAGVPHDHTSEVAAARILARRLDCCARRLRSPQVYTPTFESAGATRCIKCSSPLNSRVRLCTSLDGLFASQSEFVAYLNDFTVAKMDFDEF
jgi:hypothetical protein